MPLLWLGNFDFETTLAGENPSGEMARLSAEWAFAFLPVADPGDMVVVNAEFDREFFHMLKKELGLPDLAFLRIEDLTAASSDDELVPWGWSPSAISLAQRLWCRAKAPSIEVVRRVHCREYSFTLAEEWGVQPKGVVRVEKVEALHAVVRRQASDAPWVIKSQWGASGRGQLRRAGNSLSEQDARWAASLLRRDGVLFWEPWLHSPCEAGLQFEIPDEGEPRLIAVVPMLTDRHGQYAGSIVPIANDFTLRQQWQEAVEIGLRVCRRMQSEGYHGPVGIDAMRYVDATGAERIRPIQEINARWTMGRLAAAWRRYLPANAKALWVRSSLPDPSGESFTRRLATSPPAIDGHETRWRMELRWKAAP